MSHLWYTRTKLAAMLLLLMALIKRVFGKQKELTVEQDDKFALGIFEERISHANND